MLIKTLKTLNNRVTEELFVPVEVEFEVEFEVVLEEFEVVFEEFEVEFEAVKVPI